MKKLKNVLILLSLPFATSAADISGELKLWHTITLRFEGPMTNEYARPNPFLDYRLDATFINGSDTIKTFGYYAADGNAAETSAEKGNIWEVKFVPNKIGKWTYNISFLKGKDIAISDSIYGEGIFFNKEIGSFSIVDTDKRGKRFPREGSVNQGSW